MLRCADIKTPRSESGARFELCPALCTWLGYMARLDQMLIWRPLDEKEPMLKIASLTLLAALPLGAANPGLANPELANPGLADSVTADPRIGSWTLLSAQATLNPPDTLSITALPDAVHVVMSGETHLDFTASSNGHDTPVPSNPAFDQVELHRVGRGQSEVTEKKAGAVVGTVRERLSGGGTELTVTTASAGHPGQITVWTRTGGAKVAHDPLAGDWTEDLSKSLLRQGLMVTIAPDGSGGIRFSGGGSSYTAHLDGKQYNVTNSRNDSVSLALIDPHTVDATYRRDDQVTQRDSWVVAADGQQMTVTTTAVFETGQHLAETLVFKRQ